MTTNVGKGANRPAAMAKRNRAAQRTPLPPRPGEITDDMRAHASHVADLQKMTLAQLRAYVKDHKMRLAANQTKPELLKAILQYEEEAEAAKGKVPEPRHDPTAAKAAAERTARTLAGELPVPGKPYEGPTDPAKRGTRKPREPRETRAEARAGLLAERAAAKAAAAQPEPARKTRKPAAAPKGNGPAEETKSQAKAAAFLGEARALGWDLRQPADLVTAEEITTVTVARGQELITIQWDKGVFVGETCLYTHDQRGRSIKIHNASAAKKRMSVPPEAAEQEAVQVRSNRAARAPRKEPAERKRGPLPFTEASLDSEVIDAVRGRTVRWTNSISGQEDEARVPADGERTATGKVIQVTVRDDKAGRSINFNDHTGARSVRVSSIVEVR